MTIARGAGFWNSTGRSRTRFRPGSNLWERQSPHPAHPTTVRLQAAVWSDGGRIREVFAGGDKMDKGVFGILPTRWMAKAQVVPTMTRPKPDSNARLN
jgi:hypothetical protein